MDGLRKSASPRRGETCKETRNRAYKALLQYKLLTLQIEIFVLIESIQLHHRIHLHLRTLRQ